MKINHKISFYVLITFLLLSTSIFTGSSLATLQEQEIPEIPPPQLEKPKFPDFKIPKDSSQLLLADKIYVVWKQSSQGNTKLFIKKSTDGGNTFGTATTITSTNFDIVHYRMVVDTSNNIYVAWTRDDGGNIKLFIKKSTDGGNTFGTATTIISTNYDIYETSMVVDTSKNIYIVWSSGPTNSNEIYLKKSTDGGNTFGQTINLSNNPGSSIFPDMAIDSNNKIYVVWTEPQVIYLKKSTDGGNTFGQATTISAPAISDMAHVAVYLNNTYVTWRTATQNDEIYLKKSTDGGNTFGQTINISNTPKKSYNHHLAVYGDNIYITWREEAPVGEGLKLLIKKSTDGGNTFGQANIIWQSPSISDSVIPRIALGSGNRVYSVWRDSDFANTINPSLTIFFKKSLDGSNTFTPPYPKIINSGPGTPSYLAIITVTPKPF
jgi:hypothetical protein